MVASAQDVVWLMVGIVVLGASGWFVARVQPHWASKDGMSFTCRIQPMSARGRSLGQRVNARARIIDRHVVVLPRGVSVVAPHTRFTVALQGRPVRRSTAVFLLVDDHGAQAVLELPAGSRAVHNLAALLP